MRAAISALSSRAAVVGPSEDSDIDDLPAAEDEDEDDAENAFGFAAIGSDSIQHAGN